MLPFARPSTWCETGVAHVPEMLSSTRCETLGRCCDAENGVGRSRSLLERDWCVDLAHELRRDGRLGPFLSPDLVAVQCSLFAKSSDRNWLVALHQDLSVPVAARCGGDGLAGWSIKDDVHYVQPPVALLEQLVAVRVHLDDCTEDDGPLQVVPGSHRHGRLSFAESLHLRGISGLRSCTARRGDVVLLRPLLLHASSKATGRSRRRVLHFLFGPDDLPGGLRWHWAIGGTGPRRESSPARGEAACPRNAAVG